ncbi:MAG: DUF2059 domain-containing protein [Alphaproteobacteria bacterium]|nr:DUF2059 domain-containing protein [Alphaproteobacteria bacterium]
MKHLVLGLSLVLSTTAFAGTPDASKETVAARELLHLMHADATVMESLPRMVESMKAVAPQVPDAFWDKFTAKVDGESFIDLLVPIYASHFTLGELKKLQAFYKSPTGRKLADTSAQIQAESMDAGRTWGMQLGAKVMEELQASELAPPDAAE